MKKHLLKKTKSFFAFLLLILPSLAMTQGNPPPNVINFQSTDTLINSTMVDSVVLYSFFAHKSNINVSLNFSSKSGMDSLYSLSLLDSNQTIIVQAIDSNLNITHSNLLIGKHYFIKIEAALNDTFALLLGDTTIVIYDTNHVCGFADNCNLLTNANFDNVFPSATINNNSNPLFINGFGTAQDTMSLVDSNKNYYSNMVCDWYKILETPVIGNDSLKQNFAGMWGKFDNQECIATRTKIYPGIMYVVEYDLKSDCNSGISGANLRFGFRPSLMPIQVPPSQAASILYYNKAILPGTFSWHHETDTFTLSPLVFGSIPMKEMWIYPQSSSGNYPLNIGIDNIVLKPLSLSPATPIVNGIRFICNQTDSIFTYSITNYDSLWVYFVEVNNGSLPYSKKIFTQNFSLNLGIESVTTINLTVCGKTSSFEVYRCCNPYTATDSALYYCNDTITTNQIIDGNNISICGVLQINANVTIKNSEILFGPESSIKVGSSYTLTLINDSLADGCQRLWKGVYPTDSTSRIIVDSCYFEHSYSALNSYNNSKLQVINSVFENNNLAIHFRAYNLDKPLPDTSGYSFVAPSNAYVAGNTFKFTNSFVSNTQYISNPVGIQIDTVYKITIGDNSSVALVNIFDSLRYGIKGVNSIANIYNASFNQINQFNYQVNLDYSVDNQNVPLEGAIHFSKTKLPANSIPASTQINKAIGNQYLTIGGDSGRTCTFNNCNFGIFAENVSVQIKNNTFTNQKYNAIYIKELFDSHIINNEITMTGIYPNMDEVLKASIQIRNIQNLSAGRDVWILNNTINNSTVGISLLNTSSTAIAATNKYVKIGGNEIYFGAIDQAAGKNYCGIKIQNCNRIRVAGNIIESNTSPWTSWDVKKIVGIHIAQSKETWVADNYSIRNMTAGVYAVGHCTNTQFACNKLFHNNYGIYFEPWDNQNTKATMISSQGYAGRASDNEWFDYNPIFRIGGNLNMQNYIPNWYFRNDDIWANTFSPDLSDDFTNLITFDFNEIPNTNVNTQCAFQMTEVPEDMDFGSISGIVRNLRMDDIVFENLDYMILVDEFEYFDQEYLYEILYNNPEIMTLGEPQDTAYINFFNYITNTNIREFIELQELIDIKDINAALMANGVLVAQNVIEANKVVTNYIYLNTLAQDVDLDSFDRQNLFVIAMLTPYGGGEGVYAARAMLGIDPEDFNLPYRKGKQIDSLHIANSTMVKVYPNPADDILTIEFNNEIDNVQLVIYNIVGQEVVNMLTRKQITQLDIKALESGIYFFRISGSNIETVIDKIIKQ